MHAADLAGVAELFASPSRLAMLELLLDGREHPAGQLARVAGVRPSTAQGHLARLEAGGLVVSRRRGRERLVRLAGPAVAGAHEALSQLAWTPEVSGLRAWTRREELRRARTCYDHLAGQLGVAVADAARAAGALDADDGLGAAAPDWFAAFGIELDRLRGGQRPLLRVCTDWTERRPHLAGALGAAVCTAVLDSGWAVRRPASRALRVTPAGVTALARLGVQG